MTQNLQAMTIGNTYTEPHNQPKISTHVLLCVCVSESESERVSEVRPVSNYRRNVFSARSCWEVWYGRSLLVETWRFSKSPWQLRSALRIKYVRKLPVAPKNLERCSSARATIVWPSYAQCQRWKSRICMMLILAHVLLHALLQDFPQVSLQGKHNNKAGNIYLYA
jgi:hypothetical protein